MSNKNITQIYKRFLKLIVPYIAWPLFFFTMNSLSTDRRTEKYSLRDLFIQLTVGRGIACVFWYQFNLIMINMIFCLIIFCLNKFHLHFFHIIFLILYMLEYFGFLENLFVSYRDNIKRSIGRIPKMIVFSIIGYALSSKRILIFLKDYRIFSICISFFTSFSIIYFKFYISESYIYLLL